MLDKLVLIKPFPSKLSLYKISSLACETLLCHFRSRVLSLFTCTLDRLFHSLIFDSLCLHSYSSLRYLYVLGQSVLSKKMVEADNSHAFSSWHWFRTFVIVYDSSCGHFASVFSPRATALFVHVLLFSRPQNADLMLMSLYLPHSSHSFSPSHVIVVFSSRSWDEMFGMSFG